MCELFWNSKMHSVSFSKNKGLLGIPVGGGVGIQLSLMRCDWCD